MRLCRIVLNGQELLTSSMLVFPMAVMKRAVPWWGLPYNWIVGMARSLSAFPILIYIFSQLKDCSETLPEACSSARFS
jgi:formate/nitrite transporter FocA (FNT family)